MGGPERPVTAEQELRRTLDAIEPPDCAAVPDLLEEEPVSFGKGAGVGSGTVSALAAQPSATMPNTATPTNSPWPVPAMPPSACPRSITVRCGEKTTNVRKTALTAVAELSIALCSFFP